ncbi:DNA polymerase zeta catalytic subunit [Nymphon striatum]|nr:DNA polymerase zeta catalytic subunit [Nymphon striatum]
MIANVTYGYTSANYSGRMPCVDIADSIVSKARQTLENAIKFVQESEKWNAQVIYGDTDSYRVKMVSSNARYDNVDNVSDTLSSSSEISEDEIDLSSCEDYCEEIGDNMYLQSMVNKMIIVMLNKNKFKRKNNDKI